MKDMDQKNRMPYKLPKPIYCDPADLADGMPTMVQVEDFIRKHEAGLRRYRYLESLYEGFHDIFNQPDKAKWKPDWRLAVNFPRYITDTFSGYGYGIPVKISHDDERVAEGIEQFERYNEFPDFFAEIVKMCCVYGHAWEYMYQDEDHQTCVTAVSPKEFFCVYDDTMKKRALFAVYYGYHSTGDRKGTKYGTVIARDTFRTFEGDAYGEEEVNEYHRINAVEWQLNSERMGIYEPVAGLIELYDHTISEKSNDVDSFAEAILAVLGADIDERDLEAMRDKRLVNLYGTENVKDAVVQYLVKPSADGTQENLLDRIERLIYQIAMVANISDEAFGSATSGAALSYKLWATTNTVQRFNRKIEKSLRKTFKLWCSFSTNCPNADAWKDIDFQFAENIPRNTAEETATANAAEGLVSKRTQLGLLSYVADPDTEIERMKEEAEEREQAAAASLYGSAFEQVKKNGEEETDE